MGSEKDDKALKDQLDTLQSLVDSGYELLSQTRPPGYGLDIDLSTLLAVPTATPPATDLPPAGPPPDTPAGAADESAKPST